MNEEKLAQNLKRHGFAFTAFDTAAEAAEYLDRSIDGAAVGIGGSMTIRELDLYGRLSAHNSVFWHWALENGGSQEEARVKAAAADVYLTSANALAETGEIVNIDATGNRVASTLYGHDRVYFVVGENKVTKDYESAVYRARNVASPLNARRLGKRTPCAVRGDRCYDCDSPERICRGLVVLWEKMSGSRHMEVVLVREKLGF